jgi:hypothetical protein
VYLPTTNHARTLGLQGVVAAVHVWLGSRSCDVWRARLLNTSDSRLPGERSYDSGPILPQCCNDRWPGNYYLVGTCVTHEPSTRSRTCETLR